MDDGLDEFMPLTMTGIPSKSRNNDVSLLEFVYRDEYLFYSRFDTWVGVEINMFCIYRKYFLSLRKI